MSRPGNLDQRITIYKYSFTDDGMGGNERTKELVTKAWAEVKPKSGNENTDFERVNATQNILFRIRRRTNITAEMIIEWEGGEFNIKSFPPVSNRALYMDIEAESGVAN